MEIFVEVQQKREAGQRGVRFPSLLSSEPNVNMHHSVCNVSGCGYGIKIPGTAVGSSATK
jgi:hypothetical protein